MKAARRISPEDYILAVLSPQERLEAAFNVASEAFKDTTLKPADVRAAVEKVRKRAYAASKPKGGITSSGSKLEFPFPIVHGYKVVAKKGCSQKSFGWKGFRKWD